MNAKIIRTALTLDSFLIRDPDDERLRGRRFPDRGRVPPSLELSYAALEYLSELLLKRRGTIDLSSACFRLSIVMKL